MANELIGAFNWLVNRLTGDSALTAIVGARVWAEFAPDVDPATDARPAYPFVLFHLQAAEDVRGVSTVRVLTRPLLCVKVLGQAPYEDLQAAADRIDAVLHAAPGSTFSFGGDTYTVAACLRERPLAYSEFPAPGVRISHLGGLYRVTIY